jgi:pimeloyl-ACP methyl ester carboxylesterase
LRKKRRKEDEIGTAHAMDAQPKRGKCHESAGDSGWRIGGAGGAGGNLLWPAARKEYPAIKVPVLLVYGEEDWAPPGERERTRLAIPGGVTETVRHGNHFLPLDRPEELQQLIVGFRTN